MNRLTVLLLTSAFGLVLALALIVGHPSSASASPPPGAPAVAPIGGDQTTGVDHWMPEVEVPTTTAATAAPASTPAAASAAAPTAVSGAVPAAATVATAATTETAGTNAAAATPAAAPTTAAPATPRSNLIGPATTAPPAAAPVAATPPADAPAEPAAPADPTDPAVTGEPAPAPTLADVAVAVAYALDQIGRPYRYAAAGPNAFDCSGLTLAAYREIGVALPHRSESQVNLGRGVDWQSEGILPGDLIVTAGGNGHHYAGHVGLAVSATEWVVAPQSGQRVTREALPLDRIESVRRLVEPAG